MQLLAPGGAKDALDILRDYLGREPSIYSFIDSKTRNSLWILSLGKMAEDLKPEKRLSYEIRAILLSLQADERAFVSWLEI